jgi:hypothetical protein
VFGSSAAVAGYAWFIYPDVAPYLPGFPGLLPAARLWALLWEAWGKTAWTHKGLAVRGRAHGVCFLGGGGGQRGRLALPRPSKPSVHPSTLPAPSCQPPACTLGSHLQVGRWFLATDALHVAFHVFQYGCRVASMATDARWGWRELRARAGELVDQPWWEEQ